MKQQVFVTRSDYPTDSIVKLQEKFIVDIYPLPNAASRDALLEGVRGKDALFCNSTDRIDKEILDAAGDQLKVIATLSIGYEHIDLQECKRRGITVCNSPNPLSVAAVAEMVIGLMLVIGRRILEASQAVQKGMWVEAFNPKFCIGKGLHNSTIGIVGMGKIGTTILKRILPFEVSCVYYYDVISPAPVAEELGAKYASFEDLLAKSDYVLATCNLSEKSKGMFNAKAFSLMKPDAVFVNASRGAVVDQEALYQALKHKQIKAAGLDVMYPEPLPKDNKLVSLPNVVLLPHIASAEENAVKRLAEICRKNIEAVLEGGATVSPSVVV